MTEQPWLTEPNEETFEAYGLKCLVLRQNVPGLGHLCGYVFLPGGHKFFEKDYDDIPVDVHGGLTYSDNYEGLWKVGFDCAHGGDRLPYALYDSGGTYKTFEWVKAETIRLAEQLSV